MAKKTLRERYQEILILRARIIELQLRSIQK